LSAAAGPEAGLLAHGPAHDGCFLAAASAAGGEVCVRALGVRFVTVGAAH
jgi:hypothetical protein